MGATIDANAATPAYLRALDQTTGIFAGGVAVPMSMFCWVKRNDASYGDTPQVRAPFGLNRGNSNAHAFGITIQRGNSDTESFAQAKTYAGSNVGAFSGVVDGLIQTWVPVLAVFHDDGDGTTSRTIYYHTSANKVSETTDLVPIDVDSITVGAVRELSDSLGAQDLAEITIWDIELGDADAAALMEGAQLPETVQAANARHHWALEDDLLDDIGGITLVDVNENVTVSAANHPTFVDLNAMAGQAALGFTATGQLRHLAPIAGTVTLAFTATGNMVTGQISGDAAVDFTPTGTMQATGELAGTAPLAFAPTATFGAPGLLAGAATIQFVTSANPFEGVDRATLTGLGALLGVGELAFTTSGVFIPDAMEGISPLAFAAAAAIRAKGQLAGSVATTFTVDAALTNRHAVAVAALAFTGSAEMVAKGDLAGVGRLSIFGQAETGRAPVGHRLWPTHSQVGGLFR